VLAAGEAPRTAELDHEVADPCADAPGTVKELALTPRANRGIEQLALSLGQEFVAEDATYRRIEDDYAAFERLRPELAPLPISGAPSMLTVTAPDRSTLLALQQGAVEPWRCLNERYALASERYDWFDALGFGMATLQFAGVYRMESLYATYAKTGLTIDRSPLIAIPGPTGSLALEREATHWTYTFQTLGEACNDSPQCGVINQVVFTSTEAGEHRFIAFEPQGCHCWPS
jgi:hypothetical protein